MNKEALIDFAIINNLLVEIVTMGYSIPRIGKIRMKSDPYLHFQPLDPAKSDTFPYKREIRSIVIKDEWFIKKNLIKLVLM